MLEITEYNYETIYAYLHYLYTNQLETTREIEESLLDLCTNYGESLLLEDFIEHLEKIGITDRRQFSRFSPTVCVFFCNLVNITMENLKSLLRLYMAFPTSKTCNKTDLMGGY